MSLPKEVADSQASELDCSAAAVERESSPSTSKTQDCAVCLQSTVYPVRLPCSHIFCYLCIKGATFRSLTCPLCRSEVPMECVIKPNLLTKEIDTKELSWFYEGRGGWWSYDCNSCKDLEEAYQSGASTTELLIVGQVYTVDFDNLVQYPRSDPTRRRRVCRDAVPTPLRKGVAGLRVVRATKKETPTESTGDSNSSKTKDEPGTVASASDSGEEGSDEPADGLADEIKNLGI